MADNRVIGRRRVSCALLVLAALMTLVPLAAGSARSELGVSVTVVRSCQVDAQPSMAGTSPLRLNCASGAARDVRVTEAVSMSAPVQSEAARGAQRVVLLVNF